MPDGKPRWFITPGLGLAYGGSLFVERGKITQYDPLAGTFNCDSLTANNIEGFSVSGALEFPILGPLGVGGQGSVNPFVFSPVPGNPNYTYPTPYISYQGGLIFGTPMGGLFGNWTFGI